MKINDIFPIGIGTFRIDLTDRQNSLVALRRSFELGQNYIGTSYLYEDGKNLSFVKEFLANVNREDIYVSTTLEVVENVADIEAQTDKYLELLGLEYVDCLIVHTPIRIKIPLADAFAEMSRLVGVGKTRSLGLSNATLEQLTEINEKFDLEIFEGVYNLENKIYEDIGVLDYCHKNDIKFVAYQPLRRGRTVARHYQTLDDLAKKYSKTPSQIILNWVVKEKGILPQIKSTNIERIKENVAALDFEMSPEDIKELNEFRAKDFDKIEIDWLGNGGVTIDQLPNQLESKEEK